VPSLASLTVERWLRSLEARAGWWNVWVVGE
jgi:hypothetical protein